MAGLGQRKASLVNAKVHQDVVFPGSTIILLLVVNARLDPYVVGDHCGWCVSCQLSIATRLPHAQLEQYLRSCGKK